MSPLTCLDLFCGCGGFTLGMQRAGYRVLAAVDFNEQAVDSLEANLGENNAAGLTPVDHALRRDLTKFAPETMASLIGTDRVDVIVGGPPCQGFSTARQVDGANHGSRLKEDPRRFLYREFLRYVDHFKPSVFVMENVLGLRTAAGGEYFTRVQSEARSLGYRVHSQIEDAIALGVPQKRRRQLIIGVRGDLPGYFLPELHPSPRAMKGTLLGHALGDLPKLSAGQGCDERPYDYVRRECHSRSGELARNYLGEVLEVDIADSLTNHIARPHSDRDLRDFAKLAEGDNSATAMKRGVEFEFPYDTSSFKDRYTRQSRFAPCSTIVAHLSKDGLMFIHPTQLRSFTPREAARVQSFPDWFRFPKARTHAFRLIGNAVPPLIGEAVGLAVKRFLAEAGRAVLPHRPDSARRAAERGEHHGPASGTCSARLAALESGRRGGTALPLDRSAAALALQRLAQHDRRALRVLPAEEFLNGWHALLFLFPGLHPDNAKDHGDSIEHVPTGQLGLPGFEKLLEPRRARSGWPVALELIGQDAWRRYEADELSEDEFYCAAAQRAGLISKNKEAVA
jgi:DNA (cytosine-5)-methyltransferase 1